MDLFHTAAVHTARFDALRDRLAPGLALSHHIREDWLERARISGVTPDIAAEVTSAIGAARPPCLCTCTTLGPVAERAGAIRIDRPLMQHAAAIGGHICLVYCLQSTAQTSAELLGDCIAARRIEAQIHALDLSRLWPLFEAGEITVFSRAIADAVRSYLTSHPDTASVVLAQASMEGAADGLQDQMVPVLSAPELAFRAALTLGGLTFGVKSGNAARPLSAQVISHGVADQMHQFFGLQITRRIEQHRPPALITEICREVVLKPGNDRGLAMRIKGKTTCLGRPNRNVVPARFLVT